MKKTRTHKTIFATLALGVATLGIAVWPTNAQPLVDNVDYNYNRAQAPARPGGQPGGNQPSGPGNDRQGGETCH